MLDNVVRLREPAAWIVVAVTAASIVLSVTRFGLELGSGVPVSAAAQDVALTAMNLTLVIVVVALVWACALASLGPRTERLIAVAALPACSFNVPSRSCTSAAARVARPYTAAT